MKNPPFGGTGGANLTGKPPEMMKDEKEDPPTPTHPPTQPLLPAHLQALQALRRGALSALT